VSNNYE